MTLKLFGAILIVVSCGSIGFLMTAAHRKEVNSLEQLVSILDYFMCILQHHMLPLAEICRSVDSKFTGSICKVFLLLAEELDSQVAPSAQICMEVALSKSKDIPVRTYNVLQKLGKSLGDFGLEGQLKGINAVQSECKEILKNCTKNQDCRLRSYQTLAICAGIAVAILFV